MLSTGSWRLYFVRIGTDLVVFEEELNVLDVLKLDELEGDGAAVELVGRNPDNEIKPKIIKMVTLVSATFSLKDWAGECES